MNPQASPWDPETVERPVPVVAAAGCDNSAAISAAVMQLRANYLQQLQLQAQMQALVAQQQFGQRGVVQHPLGQQLALMQILAQQQQQQQQQQHLPVQRAVLAEPEPESEPPAPKPAPKASSPKAGTDLPAVRSKVRTRDGAALAACDHKGKPGGWVLAAGVRATVAVVDGTRLRLRNPQGIVSELLDWSVFEPVPDDADDTAPTTLHMRADEGGVDLRRLAGAVGAPRATDDARGGRRSPRGRRRWHGPPCDAQGLVDPRTINFSQNSIAPTFAKGRHKGVRLEDTLEKLRTGEICVKDIPVISVFEEGGLWYSENNRRLWVLREFGENIRVNPGPRGNAPLTAIPGQAPQIRLH